MAQRMHSQNSGNASGAALAKSVPARSHVVAGTSCCLVYNYDARKHPYQLLREIPSAFREADWWVVQLTPRVCIMLIQSRNFCDRPLTPTLCNWSHWNVPQGLAYSAMLVFNPVEPLDPGMTSLSAVLVSSHARMLKDLLWACTVVVNRNFIDCFQCLWDQCHTGCKRKRRDEDHALS